MVLPAQDQQKLRVLILTDIENEPDDAQSLVRFLTYANDFDVEGLVATTSCWQRDQIADWRIREIVEAYGKVRDNLDKHSPGYPSKDELLNLIKRGYPNFGMNAVGEDKDSEGSDWIIEVVDRPDPRAVWITIWGGSNCLAQALFRVKNSRSEQELQAFVKKIRVLTKIKKVGHAGTLDPFAKGLLLICTGGATKKVTHLIQLPKQYLVEIALGYETDTMDLTGEIIREMPVPDISEENIHRVILDYEGEIQQEIPKYSAAKYKGQRLYKLARKGKQVPLLFKHVNIYDIKLLSHSNKIINILVDCSSGTYMRTLARDICKDLKTAGHVKSLIRTRIGDYHLDNALTIEDLTEIYNPEPTIVS